ncbi:histidine phosphatase family protein [Rhizobium alvei]|uniref:Histidine phosphatase family protein n=1 Tax=Rhizobium alvei TaxID=1132659 RepID=A0ABT8YGI2_9HYPH|nr:histidine phosphatase family protein [Rhizobium alvei]MDO6962762.1 histidine phosphatase family protein [Rhizobium alvei]
MTHFIIRHGQTDWNAEYRLQGQHDIPLNDLGRRQATGNGEKLADLAGDLSRYDYVSSPLGRARETMERLREAAGLDPSTYRLEPRLVEICFGDWEGKTTRELATTDADKLAEREANKWDFVPPGRLAESYEILSWRVGSWFRSIERDTVCVCHGGVVRCLLKLTGAYSAEDAAKLDIPQDRILKIEGTNATWM